MGAEITSQLFRQLDVKLHVACRMQLADSPLWKKYQKRKVRSKYSPSARCFFLSQNEAILALFCRKLLIPFSSHSSDQNRKHHTFSADFSISNQQTISCRCVMLLSSTAVQRYFQVILTGCIYGCHFWLLEFCAWENWLQLRCWLLHRIRVEFLHLTTRKKKPCFLRIYKTVLLSPLSHLWWLKELSSLLKLFNLYVKTTKLWAWPMVTFCTASLWMTVVTQWAHQAHFVTENEALQFVPEQTTPQIFFMLLLQEYFMAQTSLIAPTALLHHFLIKL